MSKLSDKIKIIQITRNKYIEQLNLPRIKKDEEIHPDDLIKPISIISRQKEIKVETIKRSGLQQNSINTEFSEEELSKLYSTKQNLLNFINENYNISPTKKEGVKKSGISNINKENESIKSLEQELNSEKNKNKELIQDLSKLREIILTLKNQNNFEDKSKIIKEYEEKLVLLTTEITRIRELSQKKNEEIESLKLQLKHMNDQMNIIEYEKNKNLTLYDNQKQLELIIQNLRNELNQKDQKNLNFEAEIRFLTGQLEESKIHIHELEKDHSQRLNQINVQLNSEFHEKKEKEKKKILNDFDSEKRLILIEMDKLKEHINELERIIDNKNKELDELHNFYPNMEVFKHELEDQNNLKFHSELEIRVREITFTLTAELEAMEKQLRNYRNSISDYESKISIIVKENERVSICYDQKMKEVEQLSAKLQSLDRIKTQEIDELRLELNKKNTENYEIKIQEISYQLELERNDNDNNNRINQQKIINLENNINYLKIEIDRINAQIQEKQEEIDHWKNEYLKLKDSYMQINSQLLQFKELSINDHGNTLQNADRIRLENEIYYLKNQIGELENKNSLLIMEKDEIKKFIDLRSSEIGDWQQRISYGSDLKMGDNLTKAIENYKRLQKELEDLKNKIRSYENKITELQNLLQNKDNEISKTYNLLNSEKEERRRIQINLENITREIAQEKTYYESSNNFNNNSSFELLKKENFDLKQGISEYRSKIDLIQIELNKKNDLLNQRIEELEITKKKFEEHILKLNQNQEFKIIAPYKKDDNSQYYNYNSNEFENRLII